MTIKQFKDAFESDDLILTKYHEVNKIFLDEIENKNPQEFENVKAWSSRDEGPVKMDARARNLNMERYRA